MNNHIKKINKITLATLKSFVNKNRENLYIKKTSDFDGMQDCVTSLKDAIFVKCEKTTGEERINTLGICGVWLVLRGGDYFNYFENPYFKGIKVVNCCGSFVLAVPIIK